MNSNVVNSVCKRTLFIPLNIQFKCTNLVCIYFEIISIAIHCKLVNLLYSAPYLTFDLNNINVSCYNPEFALKTKPKRLKSIILIPKSVYFCTWNRRYIIEIGSLNVIYNFSKDNAINLSALIYLYQTEIVKCNLFPFQYEYFRRFCKFPKDNVWNLWIITKFAIEFNKSI